MYTTITLKLSGDAADFTRVKGLPGLAGLEADEAFGLAAVSEKQRLYCVRTDSAIDNTEHRRMLSPEIQQFYDDKGDAGT